MKRFLIIGSVLILSLLAPSPRASASLPEYSKTSADLEQFLNADTTPYLTYTDTFRCEQFSQALIVKARAAGFLAVMMEVGWANLEPHAFVSIYTTDRGQVWIEPQNDGELFLRNSALCNTAGYCWPGEITDLFPVWTD